MKLEVRNLKKSFGEKEKVNSMGEFPLLSKAERRWAFWAEMAQENYHHPYSDGCV